MKKYILSIFAIAFMTTTTFAQLGIKGGLNASRIATSNDDIDDLRGKLGFQGGLMLKIPISDYLAIQPEALYTRKGSRYDLFDTEVTNVMDYLDIPVLLMLKADNLPFSLHVGPQFSYLLRTDVTYENSLLGENISFESEKSNFEDVDLGLVAGVGFHINQMVLELRYSHSLRKYEKDTTIGELTIEPSSRHYNLQALVGYYF